jgi:hypothetical protein
MWSKKGPSLINNNYANIGFYQRPINLSTIKFKMARKKIKTAMKILNKNKTKIKIVHDNKVDIAANPVEITVSIFKKKP